MAGTIPGFDPDEVRAGLRLAMQVGLPPVSEDQPTFMFDAQTIIEGDTDGQGTPLDWQELANQVDGKAPVKVPVAIDFLDDAGQVTGFGVTASTRLLLTFLDEEFEKVRGFSHVVLGGNTYRYDKTLPPLGLVSIGIWQVQVRTADEA